MRKKTGNGGKPLINEGGHITLCRQLDDPQIHYAYAVQSVQDDRQLALYAKWDIVMAGYKIAEVHDGGIAEDITRTELVTLAQIATRILLTTIRKLNLPNVPKPSADPKESFKLSEFGLELNRFLDITRDLEDEKED